MQVKEYNWLDISKCSDISNKYFNDIKLRTKTDVQPDVHYVKIDSKLFEHIYTYQYKSIVSLQIVLLFIRLVWGFKGKTDKLKLDKVCLTMTQGEIARQLKVKKGRVIDALDELEKANILIVQKHTQTKVPNIYFLNKYYDTWNYPYSVLDHTMTDHTMTDHTMTEHTIEYDEGDTELGDTKAFPIADGTRSRLLEFVDEEELKNISISATLTILSQDTILSRIATVERYEGMMFQEAKKIRDGK